MKGRVAALAVLLTLLSTVSLAEQPTLRVVSPLVDLELSQLPDARAWEAPTTFQLFRTLPVPQFELEAKSMPPLPPVRDVLSPVGSFELFDRLGAAAGRESLETMLEKSAGDRLLLHGVLTNPWYEETYEAGRFFSIQYSEGPLCRPQASHRLIGAN